ncbi:hypothetical protein [Iodobacter sp.]|uniref:hypothetical protein n=1 Tax=Iodobacter sp. TaxID=1915058 RepID=UPI0025F43680|nr:hypothetical protein [Iodobacter sp.]
MRLVLYTLVTDKKKAERIAAMTDDIYHIGGVAPTGDGCAVRMSFTKVGSSSGYVLDEDSKMAIAASVGLLNSIDSVVFILHAYPGKLCPQGAHSSIGEITSTAAAWSLTNARNLLAIWGPSSVYFLCCEFGQIRPSGFAQHYVVPDGPLYIAQGLQAGVRIFALTEKVYIFDGMPVLRDSYYSRRITS